MICTKCNNEIPEGAKFCPSCGAAAAAPEIEKKLYCEKCGLELMKGAKFCSVCGGNGVARENKPADNALAAVDLGKPSESDSLVSAMNGANAVPAAMSGVPMPSSNIPMPVNGNSGIAASSGTYNAPEPVTPSYVASVSANAAQAPVMPVPAAGGEAAAVVKKKVSGGKIALFSVLGVLLAAIAVTLVMFFTNRATFLSTLMGKEKYATMVEGNSIKNATDRLDIPAISNGIKTASGTMQSLYTAYGAEMLDDMSSVSGLNKNIAPMSYTSASDGSYTGGGFDLESFCKEFAALLSDTYGVSSISETLSVNVELSDSLKSMIQSASFSEVNFDEMLDLINGTSLNYTLTAKDNKAAVTVGTQGKIVVNAKLMVDGQNAYIALPFASDKAVMISVPKGENDFKLDVTPLELDEKELERLITECVEIYLDYYKNSAIEMENGELKAGGVTVEGKVITAEFKGKQLSKMFTDIAKHIVKDDYLMTALADYANSLGAETTKQELVDAALEEIEDALDADDDNKLVITTVIDRNGNVLGKSFKGMYEDDVLCEISYAEADNKLGFEINAPDYDEFSNTQITIDKKDDENGTCKMKFTVEEKEISLVINYSDCKTAEFCGKKIPTGKISVGMALPEDFADQLGKENFAAVNGAKLNIAITADSASTISYTIGIDVPSYGSITFKDVVTAMNDESELKIPANVIDVTDFLMSGKVPDDNTRNELSQFANEITEAVKKALPESIGESLDYYFPLDAIFGDEVNTYDKEDVQYLLDNIKDDMADIQDALNGKLTYDRTFTTSSELESLLSEYTSLYFEIIAKGSNMTAAEYKEFEDRYWDLYIELPYFSDELGSMPSFNDPRLNKISQDLSECYINAFRISEYMEKLSGVAEAERLYGDIENAFTDLMDYCESTGAYDLDGYTDAQLTEVERLLDIVEDKIDAFMEKYRFN